MASNPGQTRPGSRGFTSGTPTIGFDGFPLLLRETNRLTPGTQPPPRSYPFAPAVTNDTFRAIDPDVATPLTHQYSIGFQREFGRNTAIEIRYVGNTNVGETYTWNINSNANWSMLSGENGFIRRVPQGAGQSPREHRGRQRNDIRVHRCAGHLAAADLPGLFRRNPAEQRREPEPGELHERKLPGVVVVQQPQLLQCQPRRIRASPASRVSEPAGCRTRRSRTIGSPPDSLRTSSGRTPSSVPAATAQLRTTAGKRQFNAMQVELRRRMSGGLVLGGSYQRQFQTLTNIWQSLRDAEPQYVDSTGGPVHAIKANWVYELPFGQLRRWGAGASGWKNALIGGWEFNGVLRTQSGDRFNYGNFRLVGLSEDEFADLFKFYKVKDAAGLERIYMFPLDFVQQSIVALTGLDPTHPSGYANGVLPTGKYLAPASGPDCVQYPGWHVSGDEAQTHRRRSVVLQDRPQLREADQHRQGFVDRSAHGSSSTSSTTSTSSRRRGERPRAEHRATRCRRGKSTPRQPI